MPKPETLLKEFNNAWKSFCDDLCGTNNLINVWYTCALLVASLSAFIPGRLVHPLLFGNVVSKERRQFVIIQHGAGLALDLTYEHVTLQVDLIS